MEPATRHTSAHNLQAIISGFEESLPNPDRKQFMRVLHRLFSSDDIENMIMEVGLDPEELTSGNKSKRIRELITASERLDKLDKLTAEIVSYCQELQDQKSLQTQPITVLPRRHKLFGRNSDVKEALSALQKTRNWGIVIEGLGGIGKTTLAIELAYRCKDKQLFNTFIFASAKTVDLQTDGFYYHPKTLGLIDLVNQVLQELGVASVKAEGSDPHTQMVSALRTLNKALRYRNALLIFDNLETLSNKEINCLIREFLDVLPTRCKAIVTSRNTRGSGGWISRISLESLNLIDALALVRNRLVTLKIPMVESEWEALYKVVGGIPLALHFHVDLIHEFGCTLSELRRRNQLRQLFDFICDNPNNKLETEEIRVLNAVAVCNGNASKDAICAITQYGPDLIDDALDKLNSFSLIDRASGRCKLKTITKQFAMTRLTPEDKERIETNFVEYWCDFVTQNGFPQINRYALIEQEWNSISKAVHLVWLESQSSSDSLQRKEASYKLVRLAQSLSEFLLFSGQWEDYLKLNRRAYRVSEALQDFNMIAWRAYDLAYLCYKRNNATKAYGWAKRAKDAWRKGLSIHDRAFTLRMSGLIAEQKGQLDRAERYLRMAIKTLQKSVKPSWNRYLLNDLSIIKKQQGMQLLRSGNITQANLHLDESEHLLNAAIKESDRIGLREYSSHYAISLATLAIDRGNCEEAEAHLKLAQEMAKSFLRCDDVAGMHIVQSRIFEAKENDQEALSHANQAVEIYLRLQHRDLALAQEMQTCLEERLKKAD